MNKRGTFGERIISSGKPGIVTEKRGKIMKKFRIPLVIVLLVVAGQAFHANAQTETTIYSFSSSPTDGHVPYTGLVQGCDGNFYGTTIEGGDYGFGGDGTVFQISPDGTETPLYFFGIFPTDGVGPDGALVQGSDGNLYGTTSYGGTNSDGTVFRISPSGNYASLYSFVGSPTDGNSPQAGLVQGSDGNFYGTTSGGGTNGWGTVFRISTNGIETVLYSFVGPSTDGVNPVAGVVQGSDGNFYGTTFYGGTSHNCFQGCGTVFRISPGGSYSNLYSFVGPPSDGQWPRGGVVQGSDGNFYGTTQDGGTYGSGIVFRVSSSGTYTNLYSFTGPPYDGAGPYAGLVQGSDGNFYGTTASGGASRNCYLGCGSVFRISTNGIETVLYSFVGSPTDGAVPYAGLIQGSDGNFYGTTYTGGGSYGTVFKLTVPLNPPANQISQIQLSGTNIVFNIPSVAYETYQLQFSSSMDPTNWINEGGTITSIGALLTLTNFGGALQPQGFYRFDITP
jgi:uncharacterized repeat protein (TIGR03803 family)